METHRLRENTFRITHATNPGEPYLKSSQGKTVDVFAKQYQREIGTNRLGILSSAGTNRPCQNLVVAFGNRIDRGAVNRVDHCGSIDRSAAALVRSCGDKGCFDRRSRRAGSAVRSLSSTVHNNSWWQLGSRPCQVAGNFPEEFPGQPDGGSFPAILAE